MHAIQAGGGSDGRMWELVQIAGNSLPGGGVTMATDMLALGHTSQRSAATLVVRIVDRDRPPALGHRKGRAMRNVWVRVRGNTSLQSTS